MKKHWTKYCFIVILLIHLSCSSESKQSAKIDKIIEFNEIFGSYVNVENKYDTLKIFESKKLANVVWNKDSILHFFEGEIEIVQFSNDPKNCPFAIQKNMVKKELQIVVVL